MKNSGNVKKTILVLLPPVVFIAFWQIWADLGKINTHLIPSPLMIVDNFIILIRNGRLWKNVSISLIRVFVGFAIGASLGMVIGFLMGLYKKIYLLLSLFVSILRPIPTIALIPVFILIMGIGESSKYAIIAIGSFWSVLLNTIHGVESVDNKLLEVGYAYRISKMDQVFRIILPSALPSMLTGMRLGVGSAWISVIGAEMIAASRGIGYMITYARDNSQISTMYAGVLTIGLIGLLIDRILITVHKFYLKKSRGIAD